MIDVLIADDEAPALAELAHLLRADPRIGDIVQARSGADALRHLAERAVAVASSTSTCRGSTASRSPPR